MTIAITNNYHQDKAAAIAAGILPANATPKKAALYDAIAEYNANQEQPKTDAERRTEIIAQAEAEWTVEDNTAHDWDGALAELNKKVLDDPNASIAEYEQAANSGKVISLYGFSQAIRRERQEEKAAVIELNKEALETGNDFDDLFSQLEQKQEEKKVAKAAAVVEVIEEIPTNCVEVKDGDDFADLFSQWEKKQEHKKSKAAQPKQPNPAIEWTQEDLELARSLKSEKLRHVRAELVNGLVTIYGATQVAAKSGLSATLLGRESHAWRIYCQSDKIKKWHDSGVLSWAKINDKLGTNSRKTLKELETIASGLIKLTTP